MSNNSRHQSLVQHSNAQHKVIAAPLFAEPLINLSGTSTEKTEDSVNTELGFDEESQRQIENKWQRVRCYGFELAGFNCLAPINVYCEILAQLRIEALPNSPNHFVGLTNVRGNLVPVYQLETLFARPPLSHRYAIMIGNPSQAGALIISQKPKQFDLAEFEALTQSDEHNPLEQDALPAFLASSVSTIYRYENASWLLLNHTALFRNLAKQTVTTEALNSQTLSTESLATDKKVD